MDLGCFGLGSGRRGLEKLSTCRREIRTDKAIVLVGCVVIELLATGVFSQILCFKRNPLFAFLLFRINRYIHHG